MRLSLLGILCFLITGIQAQDVSFGFKNYSLQDGLSQSTVYSFLEDELGYIWIGTRDGLNRFDSDNFVTFYPSFEDSNSLSNRSVRSLVRDKNGFIWVGTDGGGVDRLDPSSNSFTKLCALVISNNCELETNITSLEISNNILLIGTRNRGFFSFDISERILKKELEITSTIWEIQTTNDKILLATSSGMAAYGSNEVEYIFQEEEIRSIEHFIDEKFLIGTKTKGVLIYDFSSKKVDTFNSIISSIEIASIEIDDDGKVWIATDSQGLFLTERDGRIIKHFKASTQQANQLQSNSIRTLFKDSNGIIWIGTNNSGFSNYFNYRYQFNSYSKETTNDQLSSDVILSFNELNNGNILIGTEQQGLFNFDPVSSSFKAINVFENESIVAIEKDLKDQIWVATDGSGLMKINNQNYLETVKNIDNLSDESILSLEVDKNEDIIAGSYKGLNVISDDKVLELSYAPKYLQGDRILAIEELKNNEYLLGTFANGLVLFNRENQVFKKYNSYSNSLVRNPERIQVIHVDRKRRIWLGTYSGLYSFDKQTETFKVYSVKDGLPSDVVYGILEDKNQKLWLSTNAGISKFDPEIGIFINYSISDGLLSNEFNGGAYFQDSKENMYFGGVHGFVKFNPIKVKETYIPSNIIVHGMNVDGDILNLLNHDDLVIHDKKDFIQFDFSYLNFINSEKFILEYKLSGLSENWIPVNKRRSINFSGLAPGDYRFQLRASNNIGEISTYSKAISFYIKPAFYKTWYFTAIIILFIVIAIYSLFRYRMFYLLREEETRNRIARDLHDDLSATLSSISFFSEAAKRETDTSESHSLYLRRIDESALEAKEKINDIIWAIDPQNDDWDAFIAKCKRYAAEMLESKNIEYVIDIDESACKINTLNLRQNIWLIYKEVVTNIVRHSYAKNSKIVLTKQSNRLLLFVEDDGIGFKEENRKKGNGIANITYRVKKMNALHTLESDVNKGTKWKFIIPI